MSEQHSVNIPTPQFSTYPTIIDPPRQVTATHPDEMIPAAPTHPSFQDIPPPTPLVTELPAAPAAPTASATPVRVPYPTSSSSTAVPPPIPPVPANAPAPPASKKMALAPSSTKNYKQKRTFKVIIVGNAAVGKTCLSFRFCCGRFPEHTEATIGVDFRERSCVIESELLRVQLWDTAGQERYRQSIVAHYYRNVNAVVFVYDVTDRSSFADLSIWIKECEKHGLVSDSEVPRILIGNKCDVECTNRVSTDEAQMFADRNNMALFETSAKAASEADHVESIFLTLLHKLQQSKPMHVQSQDERQQKEQERLVLKASEAENVEEEGFCC